MRFKTASNSVDPRGVCVALDERYKLPSGLNFPSFSQNKLFNKLLFSKKWKIDFFPHFKNWILKLKTVSGMVDARGKLVPWLKSYQKASWVNFARNMTTEIIEDIRTILYVWIVEAPQGGGDALLFEGIRLRYLVYVRIPDTPRRRQVAGGGCTTIRLNSYVMVTMVT